MTRPTPAERAEVAADAITIRLDGEPVPQLRPKAAATRRKDGQIRARVYEPGKSARYKQRAAIQARSAYRGEPLMGPLAVDMLFVFSCPLSDRRVREPRPRRLHAKKPDADNCAKAVLDSLTGIVWKDDAQIVELSARKVIGAQDEKPHVVVTVWRADETQPMPWFWREYANREEVR